MSDEKKCEYKSLLNVEIKAVTEEGQIEGIGSTFGGKPDAHGDIISPKAFNRTLKTKRQVIMLSDHFRFDVIGRWDVIKKTKDGLFLKGQLNLEIPEAKKVHSHLKHGDFNGLSIGFFTIKESFDEDGVRTIEELKLVEVSVTPFPANENAGVTAVKSQALDGFSELNEEQQNQILGQIKALKMSLSDVDPSASDEENDEAVVDEAKNASEETEVEGHSDQEPDDELVDSELLNSIKKLTQDTSKYLDSELLHSIQELVNVLKDKKEDD